MKLNERLRALKGPSVELICRECHKPYSTCWSNRHSRYCSRSCKGKAGNRVSVANRYPDKVTQFWRKVDKRNFNGCWIWTGSKTPLGYGYFQKGYAHRVAYEVQNGAIPSGTEPSLLAWIFAITVIIHLVYEESTSSLVTLKIMPETWSQKGVLGHKGILKSI